MKRVVIALVTGALLTGALSLITTRPNHGSREKFLGFEPITFSPSYQLPYNYTFCTDDIVFVNQGWPLVFIEEQGSSSCPIRKAYPLNVVLSISIFASIYALLDKLVRKRKY